MDLARELLESFGSLRSLLESDQAGFCAGHGLGRAKYAQLQAVLEMGRRHLQSSLEKGAAMEKPAQVKAFLTSRLRLSFLGKCSAACFWIINIRF